MFVNPQTNGSAAQIAPPLFTSDCDGDELDFRFLSDYLFEDDLGERFNSRPEDENSSRNGKPSIDHKVKIRSKQDAIASIKEKSGKPPNKKQKKGPAGLTRSVSVDSDLDSLEGDDDDDDDLDDDGDDQQEDADLDAGETEESLASGKKCKRKRLRERQDQVDRRRERNRVLARKTRLRKKFFFESLQQQAAQLTSENEMLKEIVKHRLDPDLSAQILASCPSETRSLLIAAHEHELTSESENVPNTASLAKEDFALIAAIQTIQRSFVITDPALPDNPIIFASKGFLDLTGYMLDEVMGRNCRFMQSPNSDPEQVKMLRDGIARGEDVSVTLLNTKVGGAEFYNQIFVAALRDANNVIVSYVGVQMEIKPPSSGADADSKDLGANKAAKSRSKRKSDSGSGKSASEGRSERLARRHSAQDLPNGQKPEGDLTH